MRLIQRLEPFLPLRGRWLLFGAGGALVLAIAMSLPVFEEIQGCIVYHRTAWELLARKASSLTHH